jgi:hypothetical protein
MKKNKMVEKEANKRPVVPGLSNSKEKVKKATGKAKMGKNCSYVMKGEGSFLNSKYGKDGKKKTRVLRGALKETRKKIKIKNQEIVDRQERDKDLNKRFKESFK